MNEKTPINELENSQNQKKNWVRNFSLAIPIIAALIGSPNEVSWKNNNEWSFNQEGIKIELVTNLWDKDYEKIRTKEEMSIDYISRNFYMNWKSAKDLNATIKKISENLYSVKFNHKFLEWERMVEMIFETKYENNAIFMNFQNYKISTVNWSMKNYSTNTTLEIDNTTHNQYDVRTVWNWKRENFSVVYNENKTKDFIKNIVKSKEINNKKEFDIIPEFENTQLIKLNNPILWKEVFQDDDWYYRTLFYSTGNKKVNITNIYFNTNWEFNVEKTLSQKESLNILWINVKYNINEKWEFILDEQSKKDLIEKVRHDRTILINLLNNTNIADYEVFSWLNKQEKNWAFQFDSQIISLDPILWIYSVKLNNDKNKNLEPLYCKVEWDNVVLTNEIGKSADVVYFNYEDRSDKKSTNYYKIIKGSDRLNISKISNKLENPKDSQPSYSGDNRAISILNKSGNLTNYEWSSLEYTDRSGNHIAVIPCHRLDDLSYEVNEEYSTQIDVVKLYNYSWFKSITQKIERLTAELWIVDAYTLDIFEKCLKNEWVEFSQKLVEVTNPSASETIYYKLDNNFKIEQDWVLYAKAESCLNLIESRLILAKKINNSHIKWKNGKVYKDFELFIWWETWIWKEIIAPDELNSFISWEKDEITVRISRWKGDHTDVVYSADWNKLRTRLKSWEEKWKVYLDPQRYSITAINKDDKKRDLRCGDIVLDPKEEKE